MTAELVSVSRLTWPCHDIDPAHIHPDVSGVAVSHEPIDVEELRDGHLFIHDGRHRAIRAQLAGVKYIWAHVTRH